MYLGIHYLATNDDYFKTRPLICDAGQWFNWSKKSFVVDDDPEVGDYGTHRTISQDECHYYLYCDYVRYCQNNIIIRQMENPTISYQK